MPLCDVPIIKTLLSQCRMQVQSQLGELRSHMLYSPKEKTDLKVTVAGEGVGRFHFLSAGVMTVAVGEVSPVPLSIAYTRQAKPGPRSRKQHLQLWTNRREGRNWPQGCRWRGNPQLLTHPHSSYSAFPYGSDFPGGESMDTPLYIQVYNSIAKLRFKGQFERAMTKA